MAPTPDIFALIINPRTGEPFYADITSRRTVKIYTLDDDEMGSGYFHGSDNDDYGQSALITGLPRVHTPDGVREKGSGLGTVLYSSLCTAAHLEHQGELDVRVGVSGDGVSSNDKRSRFAEAWWTNARERYGLAEHRTGCAEDEFDESVSGSGDDRHAREAGKIAARELGTDSVDLSGYEVQVTGTYERCDIEADAYPYANAKRAGLVLALVSEGRMRWEDVTEDDIASVESLDGLLAVNMGVLRDESRYDQKYAADIAQSLIGIAGNAGASREQLDAMRARFALGIDIDEAATWTHPSFDVYKPEGVPETRENPRKLRRKRVAARRVRPAMPRVVPAPRPRIYASVRRNPSDSAEARALLKPLMDARVRLGWGIFEAQSAPP